MARELLSLIKEFIVFWHWLSNLIVLLTIISELGITGGAILWVISGFISALISELIRTTIPSYLRPIFKYLFDKKVA